MDQETKRRLAAEVFAKTGIAIDADDPAFVLVELNRMIFEDQHNDLAMLVSKIREAAGELGQATKDGQTQLAKFTQAAMDAIEKHAQAKGLQIGQWSSEEREKVRQTMRDYAGEAMAAAVDDVKKAAGVLKDERKDARSRVIIAAVIAGLVAGVVGAAGVLWIDRDREAAAEFGKTAWRVLDEKTRQKVQAAQQGQ